MSKIFKFYVEIKAKDIYEAREKLNDMNEDPLDMVLSCDE